MSKNSYISFYQAVIDVARRQQQWQWVIVISDAVERENFSQIPNNVIIVKKIPQLEILKRAKIMITHGGFNTVKECIYFAVPMVVIPLPDYDWTGNAARVAYHGIGVRGDMRKMNDKYLEKLVLMVDRNPYYRLQIKLMQNRFHENDKKDIGINLIDSILTNQAILPLMAKHDELPGNNTP